MGGARPSADLRTSRAAGAAAWRLLAASLSLLTLRPPDPAQMPPLKPLPRPSRSGQSQSLSLRWRS
eukprot:scaffold5233_cov62-Phaeocystis_antarctica.AAC.1